MVNKLQIVRVDNLTVQKVDLQIGDNIIGRGLATGNVDNAVSERAVRINLQPTGEMTITPMVACYMKSSGLNRWQSLKAGCTSAIKVGDICSLLPDKSWFKVTLVDSSTNMDDNHEKRKTTNSPEEEPAHKKLKTDNSVETIYRQSKDFHNGCQDEAAELAVQESEKLVSQTTNVTSQDNPDSGDENSRSVVNDNPQTGVLNETTPVFPVEDSSSRLNTSNSKVSPSASKDFQGQNRDEASKKIKWDCGEHFSDQTDRGILETPVEETREESTANPENNGGADAAIPPDELPRNKCAYGTRCYRQNSEHRRLFSHPGDPDYDIPDARPECPYGVRCYRKNPQHKRDFKHTSNCRSRAQTPIRGRASDATSGTEQSSAEESVDESDYEPSYYGGTSDEYRSDLDAFSDFEGMSDGEDDK